MRKNDDNDEVTITGEERPVSAYISAMNPNNKILYRPLLPSVNSDIMDRLITSAPFNSLSVQQMRVGNRPRILLPRPLRPPIPRSAIQNVSIAPSYMMQANMQQSKNTNPNMVSVTYSPALIPRTDIYGDVNKQKLIVDPTKCFLRPSAKFLCDLGLSLVKAEFDEEFTAMRKGSQEGGKKRKRFSLDDDVEYIPCEDDDDDASSHSNEDEEEGGVRKKKRRKDDAPVPPLSGDQTTVTVVSNITFPTKHLRPPEVHTCQGCDFKTDSRFCFLLHIQAGHVKRSSRQQNWSCVLCASSFMAKSELVFQHHMYHEHGMRATFNKPLPRFPCPICNLETERRGKLDRHMVTCLRKAQNSPVLAASPADINLLFRNDYLGYPVIFGRLSFLDQVRIMPKVTANAPIKDSRVNPFPELSTRRPNKSPQIPGVTNGNGRDATPKQKMSTAVAEQLTFCELCNGMVRNLHTLFMHMELAHDVTVEAGARQLGVRPITCLDCMKRFWTTVGLFYHRQRTENRCPIGRMCVICKQTFGVYLIYDHYRKVHPEAYHMNLIGTQCLICQNTDTPINQLPEHLASKHGLHLPGLPTPPITNPKGLLFCPECCLCFTSTNRLRDHMIAKGHRHRCTKCPADFTVKVELERHDTLVHTDKPRACEVCGEMLIGQELYRNHVTKRHIRPCKVVLSSTVQVEETVASS